MASRRCGHTTNRYDLLPLLLTANDAGARLIVSSGDGGKRGGIPQMGTLAVTMLTRAGRHSSLEAMPSAAAAAAALRRVNDSGLASCRAALQLRSSASLLYYERTRAVPGRPVPDARPLMAIDRLTTAPSARVGEDPRRPAVPTGCCRCYQPLYPRVAL